MIEITVFFFPPCVYLTEHQKCNLVILCSIVTQFILEQQELKLKKNSKSRKKRKQNSDDEEGKTFVHILALQSKILL